MKNLLLSAIMVFSLNANASNDQSVFITIGSDAVSSGQKSLQGFEVLNDNGEVAVVKFDSKNMEMLSHIMHEDHHRCGGFIVHDSLEEAKLSMDSREPEFAKNFLFADYSINQGNTVNSFIRQVEEYKIRTTIKKLSSFHNRYYKSDTGVKSQAFVKKTWENLSKRRNDVKVEYYKHSNWPQPSVILTVEGSSKASEVVVIGGHADSIAGFWGGSRARAPGADDNASGIATITEIIRVSMRNGFKPKRTIKFMAYAAEEVGLKGSKEIAKSFKRKGVDVVGVLQLDMTNFKGDNNKDIVFISDYTNKAQNEFLAKLVDTYVDLPWGWSSCGYACSDHASWHAQGYPASIPFESTKNTMNNKIHTDKDLIDHSGGTADHAAKFAKLGLAYLVEMAD